VGATSRIVAGLVSAGVATAVFAGPAVAEVEIDPGPGGALLVCPSAGCIDGTTTAVASLDSNDTQQDEPGRTVVNRLATNHNETVLQLA
jgi:hypothetical protein